MEKIIDTNISSITIGQWINIMDACNLGNIGNVKVFASIVAVIWRELIDLQTLEPKTIASFLEQEAPIYDNWQMLDDKYCCEKTLLKECERLHMLAKETGV